MEKIVDVIIPYYNAHSSIDRCLRSLATQTKASLISKVIIIDDFSTPESFNHLSSSITKHDTLETELIRMDQNSGVAHARNKGVQKSKAKYIAFLDADDEWLPHKLEIQINFMEAEPHIALSCGGKCVFKENKEHRDIRDNHLITSRELLSENSITTSSVIIDTTIVKKFQFPALRKRQDYAAWLLLLKSGYSIYYLGENLIKYHSTIDSLSSNPLDNIRYNYLCFRATGFTTLASCFLVFRNIANRIKKRATYGY